MGFPDHQPNIATITLRVRGGVAAAFPPTKAVSRVCNASTEKCGTPSLFNSTITAYVLEYSQCGQQKLRSAIIRYRPWVTQSSVHINHQGGSFLATEK